MSIPGGQVYHALIADLSPAKAITVLVGECRAKDDVIVSALRRIDELVEAIDHVRKCPCAGGLCWHCTTVLTTVAEGKAELQEA